jgi:hypothetical protein
VLHPIFLSCICWMPMVNGLSCTAFLYCIHCSGGSVKTENRNSKTETELCGFQFSEKPIGCCRLKTEFFRNRIDRTELSVKIERPVWLMTQSGTGMDEQQRRIPRKSAEPK